ncbi:unnamed protein product [Angiostrongylus costaricensis]|uniref:FLZ-type domain-containing protein n=1 Tax=Angiostrongylus costaricensis TaxID=334426 RepID=A0A0R3PIQ4_ANGCS|nr:unnamed protein product [Angiostrongylus costaricensis]
MHGALKRNRLSSLEVKSLNEQKITACSNYNPSTISGPCTFPLPYTKDFDIFCQLDYHKTAYICDPAGIMSRTEVEMLDQTVHQLNMTSCFCTSTCGRERKKLDFVRPSSLPAAAFLFAQLLSRHWSAQCKADLMIIYIRSWNPGHIRKPFLIWYKYIDITLRGSILYPLMRKSGERFRAGFGGGMMMNASAQQKRSVMMFRTFSKAPVSNGPSNRL